MFGRAWSTYSNSSEFVMALKVDDFSRNQFAKLSEAVAMVLDFEVDLLLSLSHLGELCHPLKVRISQTLLYCRPEEWVEIEHAAEQLAAIGVAGWVHLLQVRRWACFKTL